MEFVILVWLVMIGIMLAELGAILYHIKYGEKVAFLGVYDEEVKKNTRAVMAAIKARVIKKHLITNSADRQDNGKILECIKNFWVLN